MRKILVLAAAILCFTSSAMIQTTTLAPIIQVLIKQPLLVSSDVYTGFRKSQNPILFQTLTSSVSNISPSVRKTSSRSVIYSQALASKPSRKRNTQTLFSSRTGRKKNALAMTSSSGTKVASQSLFSSYPNTDATKQTQEGAKTSSQTLTYVNPNNSIIFQYGTIIPLSTQKDKKTKISNTSPPKLSTSEQISSKGNTFKGVGNTISGLKNSGAGNANNIVGQGNQLNGNHNSLVGNLNKVDGQGNMLY